MVKGVNKKIIEINNPDSLYFEKAVLYIRPNVTVLPDAVSRMESERLLRRLIPQETAPARKKRIKLIISALLIAAVIAVLLLLK